MADSTGTLDACADFTRGGGAPAPDHDAPLLNRKSRVAAEQCRLIDWAQTQKRLKPNHRLTALPEFARGGEHAVYYRRSDRRYWKATLPDRKLGYGLALGSHVQGATPAEYLDRMAIHNRIFADDVRLEFVLKNGGFPVIVTSQPGVKGEPPTQNSIDTLMLGKAFEIIAPGTFYDQNQGLLVFDLFPRNAILADDGEIYPIDPVIQRINPKFADFLMNYPDTIARLS